jgi:TRAP-type C4-dicarboxylate transport system substrate-binding protein
MKLSMKATLLAAATTLLATPGFAEMVLTANDPGPNRGVRAKAVNFLSEQITERTGGEVRVESNWGGALFKVTSAWDSLGTGVADMGLVIGSYAQTEVPELALGALSLPVAEPWVMMKAMDEMFTTNTQIKQRVEDANLVYLTSYALSPNLLACRNGEVKSVDDVKGVKMSDTGSSSELFGTLGANLVKMPIYDVYQSMETGLVDCTITYAYYAVASKVSELVNTMTPMGYSSVVSLATFMNKDTFDSLSEEHQNTVLQVGSDMIDYYGEQLSLADEAALVEMTSGDDPIQFLEFSASDKAALDAAAKPVIDSWIEDADASGLDGNAIKAEFISLIEKWNAVAETKGLPWKRN